MQLINNDDLLEMRAWYDVSDKWKSCYEHIIRMLNNRNVMTEQQWCVCCEML